MAAVHGLESFPASLRAAVFGASGGIGKALCDLLANCAQIKQLYLFSRSGTGLNAPHIEDMRFDLTDEASIASAAEFCSRDGPLHLVIVTTGILHAGVALQPEKTWRSLDAQAMAHLFAINCIGPALIAKHFLSLLATSDKAVFAALSARVGSIEDNRLGGWHGYRASKAALHQVIRTCAIELARRAPKAFCVALHPGTVDTRLSQPFQANVPAAKLFSPTTAAVHMLDVIDRLPAGGSGQAFAWDGSRIPF
jgi:NAD(P)-dependent dehydrogenase (short-subunit alcohol dehydrogenase family)